MILPAIALLAALPAALGQTVALWGQCGGQGYTGSTTCTTGSTCYAQNAYYSQCIPSTTSTASTLATSTLATSTLATSTRTSTASSSTSSATGDTRYIISFGDSYTQTGFYIGGNQPSESNPLGNPDFPGQTWSGGINWIGYLISEFNPVLTLSYNFASGGAATNNSIVSSWGTPLTTQVATFLQYLSTGGPWSSDDSLFVFWIGINDIGNSFALDVDQSALHSELMDTIFDLVQQVYDVGARKFLFMSVPPVEKTPAQLTQTESVRQQEADEIADFNAQLVSRSQSWKASVSGATVWQFDTQVPFNQVIANPTAYGYTDATSYCQASTCMWWDNYHPSAALNKVVAEQVAEVLDGGFW